MKLTFFGAARAVTGSCHCLEVNGKKILIDCGLQQGGDEHNGNQLDFLPGDIECVILTHAHIDHSGRLPLLVKQGFRGAIYTTEPTARLADIMLRDSAHIQESEAEWRSRKEQRAGREAQEPLYTVDDAQRVKQQMVTFGYGRVFDVCPGVKARFNDAGHLLGSASVELWLTEGDTHKKIVFSGDIGNVDQPIIRDPQPIEGGADYVVMESTYGEREHDAPESYTDALAQLIERTLSRGGNVIVPSFAVGRTQELLYYIREIKERGLAPRVGNFTVCVDSPLAAEATRIYDGDLRGYLDEEAIELLRSGEDLFTFPNLRLVQTSEESKQLNLDKTPKVIISASGMCDAGRIRHHLKHNLWRGECAVVFVGYQAEGTLGRRLLDGAKSVKLFGEEIGVSARIVNFPGLSSHADRSHLIAWAQQFDPRPRHVFVVHGDEEVTQRFANTLTGLGFEAAAPLYEEVWDLAAGSMLAAGIALEKKKTYYGAGAPSPAYQRLEQTARRLEETVARSRGRSNKDLAKLADQLKALLERWEA